MDNLKAEELLKRGCAIKHILFGKGKWISLRGDGQVVNDRGGFVGELDDPGFWQQFKEWKTGWSLYSSISPALLEGMGFKKVENKEAAPLLWTYDPLGPILEIYPKDNLHTVLKMVINQSRELGVRQGKALRSKEIKNLLNND